MATMNFADVDDFSPLPQGIYHLKITDISEEETSDTSKHPGATYWNIECTIQEGEHEDRKAWTNAMLPPYTPYTIANILRVTVGQHRFSEDDVKKGQVDVEIDDLIDLEFFATIRPQKKNPEYNEMRGFKSLEDGAKVSGGGKSNTLMP